MSVSAHRVRISICWFLIIYWILTIIGTADKLRMVGCGQQAVDVILTNHVIIYDSKETMKPAGEDAI